MNHFEIKKKIIEQYPITIDFSIKKLVEIPIKMFVTIFFLLFLTDNYTEIIMISERAKHQGYDDDYEFKDLTPGKPQPKISKKERGQHCSSTSFTVPFQFAESGRRNQVMICEGRKYIQNNKYGEKIYWKCSKWHDGCKARAITLQSQPDCIIRRNEHNHHENHIESDSIKDITVQ